eukprot:jgi/Tetstr1/444420/TSEL_032308.t1
MRTQLSLPVQFGDLGIGDNVVIAGASHIGAAALVVGQAVTFLRAQHATVNDAGAFLSDPSGVSSPHSLYLVGASSIHQTFATSVLAPDPDANMSAPMWAVELRAAHTRVVDECGDGVLEDLAGPLAYLCPKIWTTWHVAFGANPITPQTSGRHMAFPTFATT